MELLERASPASPFVPVAYQSAPLGHSRSETRKTSLRSGLSRRSPTNALGGVLVFSWQSVMALIHRVSAKRITRPAHIIFEDLDHATASLLLGKMIYFCISSKKSHWGYRIAIEFSSSEEGQQCRNTEMSRNTVIVWKVITQVPLVL